jgi:hypothetical protein
VGGDGRLENPSKFFGAMNSTFCTTRSRGEGGYACSQDWTKFQFTFRYKGPEINLYKVHNNSIPNQVLLIFE